MTKVSCIFCGEPSGVYRGGVNAHVVMCSPQHLSPRSTSVSFSFKPPPKFSTGHDIILDDIDTLLLRDASEMNQKFLEEGILPSGWSA